MVTYSDNGLGKLNEHQLGDHWTKVKMTPTEFFAITKSNRFINARRIESIKAHIIAEQPIFYPSIVYYDQQLVGYEGTHRTESIRQLYGDIQMDVLIIQQKRS